MRRRRYQIVHTHSSKAGLIGRFAARLANVPVIVHTVHGFPWNQQMHPFVRQIYQVLERLAARCCDHLIAVSELNRQELINLGIAPDSKITTIYSGIDLADFGPSPRRPSVRAALGIPPDAPVIISVGRLSPQKAPMDVIAAARLVLAQLPHCHFLLVGDGPLRKQVEHEASLFPNIHILGARADVPDLLAASDVFALASHWEGLGRALTEALATSLPVAVTAVDGVPELVEHGVTGLLSPPKSPAQLAQNILWLLEHPAEAQRMGDCARERVLAKFGFDQMVSAIDDLYTRLLREKGLISV